MTAVDALAQTRAQLTAAWDVRGIDVATIAVASDAKHATQRQLMTGSGANELLPALLDPHGDTPAAFSLGRTLGEGGMGVVKAATQLTLDREVAVKCLHDDADPRSAAQLLREARVVGALEHPNIVPVHALGADANGRPVLVMKRVDGIGWDEALKTESPEGQPEAFLRKHLFILGQVVRAAHFAHQKGIVHRDIKPSNVMLGPHDDVYLVDWGVAVSHVDGAVKGVPSTAQICAIEGTPAYMAPEMAAADSDNIGPRSDVYLLGATLYELLAGAPPHDGDTLVEVLTHAFRSEPRPLPDWVPEGVRAICKRAMARFPDERYATAQQLGDAIDVVLEHRASVILTETAISRLAELEALSNRIEASDAEDLRTMHTIFAECRFAFSHALTTWGDNEAARRGLTRAIELMVEIELMRDAPEAASLLLRDLPRPNPTLEGAAARALKRRRQKGARLERLVYDADVRVGARHRAGIALALAGWWSAALVGLGQLERHTDFVVTHHHMLLAPLMGIVVSAIAAWVVRDQLVNRLSRLQVISIVLLQVAHVIAVGTAASFDLSLNATSALMAIVGLVAFAAGTFLLDRAHAPMVAAAAGGLAMMFVWPEAHLEILGLGGGIGAALSARNLFAAAAEAERPSRPPSQL